MVGHMLGRIACAVYWFHPLVWTAARRLRDASERACDDLGASGSARCPASYAQHLLDIVTTVRQSHTPTAAIAMARRKEFEGRMLAILDPHLRRDEPSRWRTALLSVGLACFVVAVSAAVPTRREAPQPAIAQLPISCLHATRRRQRTADRASGAAGHPLDGRAKGGAGRCGERPARRRPAADRRPLPVIENHVRVSIDLGSASAPADEKMELLIRVLKTDSSASVRRVAAWGLQHYAGEPAAQAELAAALGDDSNARVRTMAAWALAHASGEPALDALRQAAANDTDADVQEMAIWGLGRQGDAAAIGAITTALSSPASERLRATAAWALGQLQPEARTGRVGRAAQVA